jgi:CHAD domain-containing protein
MRKTGTPIHMLRSQAATLAVTLPRLYDGQIEAVHAARVSSRRIREVLPLTGDWYPRDTIDDLERTFRRIGKSLGRVRDADARRALLAYLEIRIPPAAASLVALDRQQERDRLRLVRKAIKRFERLDVARVLGEIAAGRTAGRRPFASIAGRWRDQLRGAIGERAAAARESVHHATGVYFPNRIHATRIAVKKLRYMFEIACAAGASPAMNESLQHLKKTQDALGDLHDRQVLIDDLPKKAEPGVAVDPDHIRLVEQFVEAECRDLHARFLRRRPELLEICSRAERAHERRGVPVAPAAAALVISSAFYLWRRTQPAPSTAPAAARLVQWRRAAV